MKKKYMTPCIEIEEFALTQTVASCGGLQISAQDRACVLTDADTPPEFKDFAKAGMFLDTTGANPCIVVPSTEVDDKYCVHTSVSVVFTS